MISKVSHILDLLHFSVLNPQFLESPGEPIKRAYIPAKNSFWSIYFETLRRAKKKRDVKTLTIDSSSDNI